MHSKKLICDILIYINQNINKNITIDELSNIFFFDKFYIMKLFKKELNITIINYINAMRIYNSLKDFKYNNNIMRIALNNGFNSIEYFSETFKNVLKISPREYKYFIKRNNKLTLNKIIDIRISIANLQYLKDKTNKYINNRPPEETKVKILSIFNTK
jgi:AraC-like DNA-binding protein